VTAPDLRRGRIDGQRGTVDCAGCRDALLLPPTYFDRPQKRREVFATAAKKRGWRWSGEAGRVGWYCPICARGES